MTYAQSISNWLIKLIYFYRSDATQGRESNTEVFLFIKSCAKWPGPGSIVVNDKGIFFDLILIILNRFENNFFLFPATFKRGQRQQKQEMVKTISDLHTPILYYLYV